MWAGDEFKKRTNGNFEIQVSPASSLGKESDINQGLQLGIDLVHFGLVMVLNLMIGLLRPPTGMVLFVLARVAKLSTERTTIEILPWLVPLLGSLVIITYFPKLVLWLPKMFY